MLPVCIHRSWHWCQESKIHRNGFSHLIWTGRAPAPLLRVCVRVTVQAGVSHVLCPFRVKFCSYLLCGLPCTMSRVSVFLVSSIWLQSSVTSVGFFPSLLRHRLGTDGSFGVILLPLWNRNVYHILLYNAICFRKGEAQVVTVWLTFIPAALTSPFLPVLASLPL